jgi:preprotein translocase subunit SecE
MSSKDADIASKKKSSEEDAAEPSKFSPGQIKQFAGEVKSEFGKIAWPAKKHTMGSTAVVVVLVILVSVYLGAVDLVLGKIVSSILG